MEEKMPSKEYLKKFLPHCEGLFSVVEGAAGLPRGGLQKFMDTGNTLSQEQIDRAAKWMKNKLFDGAYREAMFRKLREDNDRHLATIELREAEVHKLKIQLAEEKERTASIVRDCNNLMRELQRARQDKDVLSRELTISEQARYIQDMEEYETLQKFGGKTIFLKSKV